MFQDQVSELHDLQRRVTELQDEIQRKIDGLVITVLTADVERSLSAQEVFEAVRDAGFDLPAKEVYSRLNRLAQENRVRAEGPRFRGIRPDVLNRQLRDTPAPPK